ncbi:hypothetical protein C9374_011244 [Naegleria lovaniensis]|uniref:C2 domain-containing protein n=1 Tax=Naegleria lovaniensis TaxID=51637 RepID=A0AA88GXS9_NAELO|nr:uncharacterized protein C9374_011244 [Naegleria lovaniensis]KAG2392519.1 hypothetical protein C9374_011244 [Naegleria lovaniensis]
MSNQGSSHQLPPNSHPLPFLDTHDHKYNLPYFSNNNNNSESQLSQQQFIATLQWKSKSSTSTHDLDLVAILVNKQGGIHDVCFFNNLNGVSGMKHGGDDRNGNQNLDSSSASQAKEPLKDNITLETALKEANENIQLDLSKVDHEVRCIVFLACCYPGTVLSELSHVTCNLYQFTQSDNEKAPLKRVIVSNLDVSKDASGQVFAIIQLRGGDAEAITTVIPGKEKESIKDEMDDETQNSDSLSASPSPAISQGHLKEAENVQEHEDTSTTQANYYWQIVSKQVDIATHERFMDSFMYAMCKRVLPENIFISMKNRLTYIIHLRQEEKKNQILDSMVFSSILKDEDHDEDEEYIVRVYSELTGSILIDQLIVEEAQNYLKTVLETSAEKSPFIPISRDEFTVQEANNKLAKSNEEEDKTQLEKQEPPTVNIQKSYTFNEDRIKIYIGWQSLSGRSYSRYYLTATVLFFGKYGARLGHIDQYTTKLSLVKLESANPNTTTAPTTGTTASANAPSSNTTNTTSGMGSPRTSPLLIQSSSSMTLKSPRSGLHKPKPAAIFLKGNRDMTGNDSDLCAEVDLSRLPKSVHSIIVVVTATSNAQDSGFQELKDPYVKITTSSAGDLYRYQLHTSERAYQSFIACRFTCLRNPNDLSSANLTAPSKNQIGNMYGGSFIGLTKWRISNIGEYSLGVHPLIDPHLKSQIQKHVPTIELPPCLELATQTEIEEQEREKLLQQQQQQENKSSEGDNNETLDKEDVVLRVSNASDLDLTVTAEEPKKEKPKCFRIPKQEVKTVGFDFSTVKNLDSIQVLEFSQYGKLLTGAKPTMVNEANDLKKRKLALSKKSDHNMNIPMSESFTLKQEEEEHTGTEHLPRQDQMFQSLTSFHRMDLTYSKESHAPYFMCFLLKFKDIITNEDEDALDYSLIPENRINCFRLWNVDEKVDMCVAKLTNVFNIDGSEQALQEFNWQQDANLAVIAYRSGQKDEWFIEVLDEIVTFKSPARRYLRSMLQKCQFDISEPSCDVFTVPTPNKDSVTKEFHKDCRDLVLGFGIVGNGGQQHLLNAEVEIYDHFGRYLGKVYEGYSDMDAKLKHRPINFLTIYTQDDEEQFDIRMKDLIESSTVKYIVANIEVKSRSVLNDKSQIYSRVVDMRSGKELVRVQASGSLFLDKYTPKKTLVEKNQDAIDEVDDDSYDSGDESDNEVVVTMCVIEFTKEGWRIMGAGEKNLVDLIPKYISLKPEAIKIEIIKGRNLIPVDHGSADPYLRIKLNEKNSRKGAKKQKVRSKLCNRTIHPDWHETHTIHIFDYDDTLIVKCMDYEKTRDQYMGEVRLKVGFLLRLHNQGRERKFVLRNDEYWKAVEGKLTGMKKEMALASQPMGDLFMRFSIGSTSDIVTKK